MKNMPSFTKEGGRQKEEALSFTIRETERGNLSDYMIRLDN
jgi:hypothetical protein